MRRFAVVVFGQAVQKMRELKESSPADYQIIKAWIADFQERGVGTSSLERKIRAIPTKYILICDIDVDHTRKVVDISVFRIEEE